MHRKTRSAPLRHFSAGTRLIERAISHNGAPVIGLHLYMAFGWLTRSMARGGRFASIKPALIGIPALLKAHPGLSQTQLADLMGIERMTAGVQVKRCIAKLIPLHEQYLFGRLSRAERAQLYRVLRKLIEGSNGQSV